MQILNNTMTVDDLRQMAAATFGDMVKSVVDADRRLMAVDAELHADLEALLLENGSKQRSLWGINVYPDVAWCEYVQAGSVSHSITESLRGWHMWNASYTVKTQRAVIS
jgi:hypothetical protein